MGRRVEKWTMKNGEEIDIRDMTDRHLKNSYKMLKRSGAIDPSTFKLYFCCNGPSGEMAQYYFDQEFEAALMAPKSPFVGWFEEEMERRGIDIPYVEPEDWN